MQYADVSQHDWHLGQILCNTVPSSQDETRVHCVLIDFSQASIGIDKHEFHRIDDFGQCLRTLCNPRSGFRASLVWDNFGLRETWDQIGASVNVDGESKWTIKTSPLNTIAPWGA